MLTYFNGGTVVFARSRDRTCRCTNVHKVDIYIARVSAKYSSLSFVTSAFLLNLQTALSAHAIRVDEDGPWRVGAALSRLPDVVR